MFNKSDYINRNKKRERLLKNSTAVLNFNSHGLYLCVFSVCLKLAFLFSYLTSTELLFDYS